MHKHSHVILIIENKEHKYLQYYDKRWNSFLFLNIKVNKENFEDDIYDFLINQFNINKNQIQLISLFDKIHTKYSESSKTKKEYHHFFYKVIIKELESFLNQNNLIYEKEYTWLDFSEMKKNARIMEVNKDIIEMLKKYKNKE